MKTLGNITARAGPFCAKGVVVTLLDRIQLDESSLVYSVTFAEWTSAIPKHFLIRLTPNFFVCYSDETSL